MRRVVFNQKGGVGKSSITCNLAAISAAEGLNTLVVDLDVQGNATHYLGLDETQTKGVADLLSQTSGWFSGSKKTEDFVHETEYENLYLLPASNKLTEIESQLESRYKMFKLRDTLKELESRFDRIYIDTPPALSFYTKSALIAAQSVLMPFDCDSFSQRAIYTVLDNIAELRNDHNPQLTLEGIIINQFNPQAKIPKTMVTSLEEEGLPVLNTYLHSSVKMKESHHSRIPLVHLDPKHKLTQQFLALHEALEAMLEENSAA